MLSLVRLRRHRVSALIAVFIVVVLYQLNSLKSSAADSDRLKDYAPPKQPHVPPQNDISSDSQAPVPAPKPKGDLVPIKPPPPPPPPPPSPPPPPPPPPAKDSPAVEAKPKPLEKQQLTEKPQDEIPKKPAAPSAPSVIPSSTSTTTSATVKTVVPSKVPELRPIDHLHLDEDAYPELSRPNEHYSYPKPYYPLPSPLISIPPPLAAVIPQIQADFAPETAEAKRIRLHRQKSVKDAFLVSWNAYKTYAMPHDELRPVTLKFKDPFGGWGATLVDALDTLWIMGLTQEFDKAVKLVADIDFTTNSMGNMKVFETVIRYLGGLVGAWDLATEGGQRSAYKNGDKEGYKILLVKAQELADILLGAFDTPNRMPILSWDWKLEGLARHPRANTRSVAAEFGSLAVEFTRLAQITGNATYYDAIARITNALDEFQMNTTFPGLWPIHIDASGCKKLRKHQMDAAVPPRAGTQPSHPAGSPVDEKKLRVEPKVGGTGKEVAPNSQYAPGRGAPGSGHGDETLIRVPARVGGTGKEVTPNPQVAPTRWPAAGRGIGDEAPIHVLPVIGGTGAEVHTHEKRSNNGAQSTDGDDDITEDAPLEGSKFPSRGGAAPSRPQGVRGAGFHGPDPTKPQDAPRPAGRGYRPVRKPKPTVQPERCQPQGLAAPRLIREEKYGLGAMIDSLYEYLLKQYLLLGGSEQYKRMYSAAMDVAGTELTYRPMAPQNPDILLAGNVYVSRAGTKRRFEPESSHLACFAGGMFAMGARVFDREKDLDIGDKLTAGCAWAYGVMETGIMPEAFEMAMCPDKKNCTYTRDQWAEVIMLAEGFADPLPTAAKHTSPEAAAVAAAAGANARPLPHRGAAAGMPPSGNDKAPQHELERGIASEGGGNPTPVHQAGKRQLDPSERNHDYDLRVAKELTEDLIESENIPEGFTRLGDRRYILRPEAIESVWYMYRISGDLQWANKGWRMWTSTINAVTVRDEDGAQGPASAIEDVNLHPMSEDFKWSNSMESFWFGETLKYYYLLFSTPDTISLDDYVLNTEAHPFRRADFGKRGTASA